MLGNAFRERDEFGPEPGMALPDIRHWHKGLNFQMQPAKAEFERDPLTYVLHGWMPKEPLITESTRLVAFGSCFAANFIGWLADHGFGRNLESDPFNMLVAYRDSFENVAVIEQQVRWAFGELDSRNALWI